jgi:iron complex transport system ATP-binding protein
MGVLLKVDKLSGGYGREIIINDISFEMERGEFIGIIGPNGSGKSTLLKLISRVIYPKKGEVLFQNENIIRIKLKELCKNIAFVPQDTVITFSFSVWEVVLLGRTPHLGRLELETKKDFSIAENALILTDTLNLKEKNINQLSAGERQRVIIAKALAQEPTLLILDEPTSHLDIGHQIEVLDLLKKLNKEKKISVIIVLHDLNLASEYCSRIILLNKGEIFKDGPSQEVLTYQNIESVYKTIVVVNKNPISLKPYIVAVSNLTKNDLQL